MNWWTRTIARVFGKSDGFGASMIADLGANGRPPRRDSATIIEIYNSSPILRAIVDRISGNVASNRWRLYKTSPSTLRSSTPRAVKDFIHSQAPDAREKTIQRLVDTSELEEITSHPILELIRKPNPTMSGVEFRKVEQAWMDLDGESFTVIDRKGTEPDTLWPIVPWWVQEIPSTRDGHFVVKWRSGTRKVAFDDMIWMRNLNPSNPYGRGSGIAQTLNNELDSDEYASIATTMRMFNGGAPKMIVMAEGLKTGPVEVLQEDWRKQMFPGYLQVNKPLFTNAKNLKIERLEDSLVDMDIVNLREFLTHMMIQGFGMPPEIIGLVENSNRATINSAFFLYACNLLMPRLMVWENTWNETLVRQFGRTDLLLLFDNPIPEDREFALKVSTAHKEAFSIDDIRELADMSTLETEMSKMHPVPGTITLRSFEEGAEKEQPLEVVDVDDDDDENTGHDDDDEEKGVVLEILEPIEISEKEGALDKEAFPKLIADSTQH